MYNDSQSEPYKVVGPGPGLQSIIGPGWFDAFSLIQDLPFNYVYQVPLTFGSIENSVTFAKKGLDAIGLKNLYAIEIGNEPDIGRWKGNVQDYVNDWLQYAEAISGNLTSLPKSIFQGLALSSEANAPWNV